MHLLDSGSTEGDVVIGDEMTAAKSVDHGCFGGERLIDILEAEKVDEKRWGLQNQITVISCWSIINCGLSLADSAIRY